MNIESIVAECCLVAFIAGVVGSMRAKEHLDRAIGIVVAIASVAGGLASLMLGHQQGDTITSQGQTIASQQHHIEFLDKENLDQLHLITILARNMAGQEKQIVQTNSNINATTVGLVAVTRAMGPRELTPRATRDLVHFAREHQSCRYLISAKKDVDEAKYLANGIRYALGAQALERDYLVLTPPVNRIMLLTSPDDGSNFAGLYRALVEIDLLADWQKNATVPKGSAYIFIGGR